MVALLGVPYYQYSLLLAWWIISTAGWSIDLALAVQGSESLLPTPTALPSKPKENARVIVAPCSPLMATQQQWAVPSDSSQQPAPLALLAAPGMLLHLQPVRQQIGLAAVVRTAAPSNASVWRYNKTLSVLELATPGPRMGRCLHYLLNAQFSNVAAGDCAKVSWSATVDGPTAGAGLSSFLYNTSDSTVRFIYRDAYNLNHQNSSICLTATWGEPCEPAEFAKLPFCDTSKSADERVDDLLRRATVEEQAAMLSADDANRPWLPRLSVK